MSSTLWPWTSDSFSSESKRAAVQSFEKLEHVSNFMRELMTATTSICVELGSFGGLELDQWGIHISVTGIYPQLHIYFHPDVMWYVIKCFTVADDSIVFEGEQAPSISWLMTLLSIIVRVEISFGSKVKYEYNDRDGQLYCDRVLHTPCAYPFNYGYIENTLAGDGDHLDAVILTDYPLAINCLIRCRIIGALLTKDNKGNDEKVLVVPITSIDPEFVEINDLDDLSEIKRDKVKFFFEHYKRLEPGKWVQVDGFARKEEAVKIYQESCERYNRNQ